MPSALFFICPYYGHILPVLSLVKELTKRGHEIFFYSTPAFTSIIEQNGAQFKSYPHKKALQLHFNHIRDNTSQMATLLASYQRRFEEQAILTDFTIKEIEALHPDYIVYDYFDAYWAKRAACQLNILHIASVPTFAIHPNLVKVSPQSCLKYILCLDKEEDKFPSIKPTKLIRHLNMLIKNKYHSADFDLMDYGNSKYLNLVYTSPYFQPYSSVFPECFKFIGLDRERAGISTDFPYHMLTDATLIYISMGMTYYSEGSKEEKNDILEIFRKCMTVLEHFPYQVVISTGNNINIRDIGYIPENVIIQPFVPQIEMLQRAAIFISHGGMNSVNEALYLGVPMILIPQVSDQFVVADRVMELGAGVVLPQDFALNDLSEMIERVLSVEYSGACHVIQESLLHCGGATAGANEIINLLKL